MKLAACLATVSTVLVLGCSNSGDSSSAVDSGSNGGACASAAACGGSGGSSGSTVDSGSDGGACPTVAACGGTIVPGTYTITSFCEHTDPVPADELCQGATVAISDADLSGVVAFSDATNYVTGVSGTIHSVLDWPASCLGKLGGPTTCAELQQRLGPDQADPPTTPTTSTVTCSGTDSCTCNETDTKRRSAMGTYSTTGNVLTFSPNDNGISATPGTPLAYCVSGNQIAISATRQIGTASVSLFMVLTLQ